jgi:hypothetical protein
MRAHIIGVSVSDSHGRDQNGDRQRHGKLAEQPPDDIAHKQQRDQHRNHREGE